MPPLRRLLTALAVAGAVSSGLPAAPAAAADTWSVSGPGTLTVQGRGYGHGHGMSQYGAEGAARRGLTHEQIVAFYYPGTALGRAAGKVRVLVTADTSEDVVVRPRSGLSVRDTAGGGAVALPANGATAWRLSPTRSGRTKVSFEKGRWHTWRRLSGDGEVSAGGQPVTLVLPTGERAYRGRLRLAATSAGHDTVNVVPMEVYLRGVVPLEMPATWSPEAVQAQAVAARTYAAYERSHPRAAHYDLCDTTSCQVYGGAAAEHPSSDAAVAATRGHAVLADGKPAFTQFSSSNGGWGSAGSVPYLAAQQDPYDGWAGNPVRSWSVQVTDAQLERAWPAVGDLRQVAVTRRDGQGDWGGRVSSLTVTGTAGKVTVSGDAFRSALGLRSTYLTLGTS